MFAKRWKIIADAETQKTAIAVGAEREVSAGFCATDGTTRGAIYNQNFTADELPYVQNACRNTSQNAVQRYEFNNSILFIENAPIDEPNVQITGAFAARSIGKTGIFADRFNFLTQAFLLVSAIGLLIFSFLTLREWRGGMRKIEMGLSQIPHDLSKRIGRA